jgi:hypothetical protein
VSEADPWALARNVTGEDRVEFLLWSQEAAARLDLSPTTVYISAWILDSLVYRSANGLQDLTPAFPEREDLRLLTLASLWMAAKMECDFPPRSKDFVDLLRDPGIRRTVAPEVLHSAERVVFEALSFNVAQVTAAHFLYSWIQGGCFASATATMPNLRSLLEKAAWAHLDELVLGATHAATLCDPEAAAREIVREARNCIL